MYQKALVSINYSQLGTILIESVSNTFQKGIVESTLGGYIGLEMGEKAICSFTDTESSYDDGRAVYGSAIFFNYCNLTINTSSFKNSYTLNGIIASTPVLTKEKLV